jgi:hypothetical protein
MNTNGGVVSLCFRALKSLSSPGLQVEKVLTLHCIIVMFRQPIHHVFICSEHGSSGIHRDNNDSLLM